MGTLKIIDLTMDIILYLPRTEISGDLKLTEYVGAVRP